MIVKVDNSAILTIVTCALKIIWVPLEYTRLYLGYTGNLNESFPEIIAFLLFTLFFIVPLSILPCIPNKILPPFPHERATLGINIAFVLFELIVGIGVMCRSMRTRHAGF